MLENCILITGTDTDVGKTVISSALIAYWRYFFASGQIGVIKLLQTGIGDRQWYETFCDESITVSVPVEYSAPLAPPIAAQRQGETVNLAKVWQELTQLSRGQDFVIAEALGSLGSPVTDELTVADLAGQWHLPTIVVVPVRLGSIGQAIAQISLARQRKVNIKGIVLNCENAQAEDDLAALAPPEMLQRFTQVPVLGVMPYVEDLNNDYPSLAKIASGWTIDCLVPQEYWQKFTAESVS